jgi:hypothetical protein
MIHIKEKMRANALTNAATAKRCGHTCFLGSEDGDMVAVLPTLKNFFMEYQHKHKNAVAVIERFAGHRIDTEHDTFFVQSKITIAFDYALDLPVGIMEVLTDDKGKTVYSVTSDTIENERYKPHNPKYRVKESRDFKTAVKTARQHLKAFDFTQVMRDTLYVCTSARDSIAQGGYNAISQALRFNTSELMQEIRAMVVSGYTPKTEAFANAATFVREKGDEMERVKNYRPQQVFVWLQPHCAVYQYMGNPEAHTAHTVDELPEEVRNKIAVLNIGEKNSPIIDVGVKVDDTKYWVFMS